MRQRSDISAEHFIARVIGNIHRPVDVWNSVDFGSGSARGIVEIDVLALDIEGQHVSGAKILEEAQHGLAA